MNRRPLWILLIVGVLVVAGAFAFGTGLLGSGAGASASPGTSPGASGSPAALATGTGTGSPSAPAPSSVAPASPAPSCVGVAQRVAVRATAADTGFPIPVQWTDLGPADDLHLFLSDVAPTILITPAGPSSLNVGLSYITGGDNVAFTAGSVTLTYDLATGRVSGPVATGYGEELEPRHEGQPAVVVRRRPRPDRTARA